MGSITADKVRGAEEVVPLTFNAVAAERRTFNSPVFSSRVFSRIFLVELKVRACSRTFHVNHKRRESSRQTPDAATPV